MAMALLSEQSNYKNSLHSLSDNNYYSQSYDFQWQVTDYFQKCLMFSGEWLSQTFQLRNYFGQLILNCSQCRWKLTLILQENVGVDGNCKKISPGSLLACKYKYYNEEGILVAEHSEKSKKVFCEIAENQEFDFTWWNRCEIATVVVECFVHEQIPAMSQLSYTPFIISYNEKAVGLLPERIKKLTMAQFFKIYKRPLRGLNNNDNNCEPTNFQWKITDYSRLIFANSCTLFSEIFFTKKYNYTGRLILKCLEFNWKLTLSLEENITKDDECKKIPPGSFFVCKYTYYNEQSRLVSEQSETSKNAFCETAGSQEFIFTWWNHRAATVVVECLYVEESGTAEHHLSSASPIVSYNKSVLETLDGERKQAPGKQLPSDNHRFNRRRYVNSQTPYNMMKIVGAAPAYYYSPGS